MRISLMRISYRVCGSSAGTRPSPSVRASATVSQAQPPPPGAARCSVMSTPAAGRPRAVSSTWLMTGDVAPAMHNRSVPEGVLRGPDANYKSSVLQCDEPPRRRVPWNRI